MSRHSRSANTRVKADLSEGRSDVKIQEQRRFFQARGNDRGVREARALAAAFDTGVNAFGAHVDRQNVKGQERAMEQAGSGGERDVDDKNAAYHRVWDRLDDEKGLNQAKVEIPEMLRQMDAENQPEEVVQAALTGYMKDQFQGIDLENEDHTFLARGLLELEMGVIEAHRTGVLAKIKQSQLHDTYTAEQEHFAATGEVRYDVLMERTNTFTEREEKKTAYWEMVFDLAIESGDPSIIENAPEQFADGSKTAKNIDKWLDEKRTAIRAATVKQAANAKASQDVLDAQHEGMIFDTQMAIFATREQGGDVSPLIAQLASIPGVEFSHVSAAKNFGDSQLDEKDSRSANLPYGVALWNQVFNGTAGPQNVLFAFSEGLLGSGPQAKEEAKKLMSAIESVRKAGESNNTQDVTQWRGVLNKRYNAQLGGLLSAVNPVMNRINIDANSMYIQLTQGGTPGADAANQVFEKFDSMVNNLPDVEQSELTSRRGQDSFTGETSVSLDVINGILSGNTTVDEAFTGVPTFVIQDRLMDEIDAGNITEAQAIAINQQL